VHGWCIGGGVDLISAVDIRYASADADAALTGAHATAAEIAANPPLTVHGIKDVLDQQRISAVSASLRYVAAWNAAFLPSKDLSEGISATFAKRPPQFTGE
jgi:enoyl-CoA hydratase